MNKVVYTIVRQRVSVNTALRRRRCSSRSRSLPPARLTLTAAQAQLDAQGISRSRGAMLPGAPVWPSVLL